MSSNNRITTATAALAAARLSDIGTLINALRWGRARLTGFPSFMAKASADAVAYLTKVGAEKKLALPQAYDSIIKATEEEIRGWQGYAAEPKAPGPTAVALASKVVEQIIAIGGFKVGQQFTGTVDIGDGALVEPATLTIVRKGAQGGLYVQLVSAHAVSREQNMSEAKLTRMAAGHPTYAYVDGAPVVFTSEAAAPVPVQVPKPTATKGLAAQIQALSPTERKALSKLLATK